MALFGRRLSLLVGTGGQGLELAPDPSNLPKVTFRIRQFDRETPNTARIRVYNLADGTVNRIRKEFTDLTLQAGYVDGPFGVVFQGTIIQVKKGWEGEGGVDSYVDIIAADGDQSYAFSVVNTAIAKGSTFQDRLTALTKAASPQGVSAGYTAPLPANKLPRGRVYYGNWRDHMRALAFSTDTVWSVQNGKVQVIPLQGYLPGEALVLTSRTGLIGWPEQTEEGIKVRSLLNPKIKIGGRIQLDNASILQADLNTTYTGSAANSLLPSIAADGIYRVVVAEPVGDTRGNDWYTDMICIALGEPVTPSLAARGYS
jgi:hypothetical protein